MLAAVVLSGVMWRDGDVVLLIVSLSCFYAAGMCVNDLVDRHEDRKRRPDRPLPSGRVSVGSAKGLAAGLFAVALGSLWFVPHREALWAGGLLLVAILAYNHLHKRYPWSVGIMAGCRLLVFVVVGLAVAGAVTPGALLGGIAQFLWVLLLSVVARYENQRPTPFALPVIPAMVAAVSLVDGALMALLADPVWGLAGIAGAGATWFGNRAVRGD